MLKKTIHYTDFNDQPKSGTYYFHLSKAKVIEMQFSHEGGLVNYLTRIAEAEDGKAIISSVRDFIKLSYGVKSADGEDFIQSEEIWDKFERSPAYSELLMEVATDAQKQADFIQSIIPRDMASQLSAAVEKAAKDEVKVPVESVMAGNGRGPEDTSVVLNEPQASEPLPRDEIATTGPKEISLADVPSWDPNELRDKIASGEVVLK